MERLELPDLEPIDLDLAPVEVRADQSPEAQARLRGRVSVGRPLVRALAPGTVEDADLRSFLEAEAGQWAYYGVVLACTFHDAEGEPFAEGYLEVELDGGIAWSLAPARIVGAEKLSTGISLTAKAKVFGAVEVGPEAQVGREVERELVFLQAYGEHEPVVYWEMRATAARSLAGTQKFAVVVRVPADETVRGTVAVEAKVRRRWLGVIPYKAHAPGAAPIAFAHPPQRAGRP